MRLSRRVLLQRSAAAAAIAAVSACARTSSPARPIPRIGYLASSVIDAPTQPLRDAFQDGLRDHGYVIDKNIQIEWRATEGRDELFEEFVSEFVKMRVDVMVSSSAVAQQAAKRATATIPIVMLLSSDPVDAGLIESLARPGTNVTGMAILTSLVTVKQLELLNEAFPQAMRVAVLTDDIPSGQRLLVAAESAARSLRIGLIPLPLRDEADLPGLLELATSRGADALLVPPAHFQIVKLRDRIVAYAAARRIPASYTSIGGFVESGGLMSFGTNGVASFRRAADFVDRILKGANPAEIPVEQPTEFDIIINLRTARELGLTIPASVLTRATQVIP